MVDTDRTPRHRELRVVEVVEETDDARSIAFAVAEEDRQAFAYRPGQFLTLRIPSDREPGGVARCYSMASSPHVDDGLVVTVKRVAEGYASNWLCDNVRVGDRIEVLPPSGAFIPPSLDSELLLFGAGSGITPVFSILKSALHSGTGRITLFYANRDESSVIFARGLRALTEVHPERLTVVHWLESLQGLPGRAALKAFARRHDHGAAEAYICGPGPFMEAVTDALAEAGFAADRVHSEVYTSLSGNPFDQAELARPTEDTATVPTEVELDGETHRIDWPVSVPLVDVLLDRGVDVPYMCRDGECGSCQATVEAGSVTLLRNDVLEPEDLADGYVLTCQALPDGDGPIRIVF